MNNDDLIKHLQLEQMDAFSKILSYYRDQINLNNDILEALTLADFSDKDNIQKLYNAIQCASLAYDAFEKAFKAYSQSHNINLVEYTSNS